ncbi:MAG: hypothetical protein MUP11_11360, partial [Anaerolineales bacterium]|nr:hypothetical protein [Anaerolineales bacterium]
SRLDILDTFLEGLSYERDEPVNPQELFNELRDLVRIQFELTPNQIRELAEGPGVELAFALRSQVESQLQDLEIKRLVGGVERLLGAPLEGDEIQAGELVWESISGWIVKRVKDMFETRYQSFFTDPEDARVIKSIEAGLRDIQTDDLSDADLVNILGLMAEGKQAAFDKKSHKRIWLRTQRLRYTFYAAALILKMSPEAAEIEILTHLEYARQQVQKAWAGNELNRLKESQISLLDEDLREKILKALGKESYTKVENERIESLPDGLHEILGDLLGRSVVSKIYRDLFLRVISELWVEYLTEMEALRVAIGLEAYAQRDPLVQYKTRGFEMFQKLMEDMRVGVVNRMFTFQPRNLDRIQAVLNDSGEQPESA